MYIYFISFFTWWLIEGCFCEEGSGFLSFLKQVLYNTDSRELVYKLPADSKTKKNQEGQFHIQVFIYFRGYSALNK